MLLLLRDYTLEFKNVHAKKTKETAKVFIWESITTPDNEKYILKTDSKTPVNVVFRGESVMVDNNAEMCKEM